ncbi:MAG: glycosyltransferase [Gammaproteobacteria bacterium]|nr:glycosyltransferase [Gammaproteobacteria bacterium]
MKRIFLIFCLLFGLITISGSLYAATTKAKIAPTVTQCSQSKIAFNKAMRSLWETHVIYTRNYIISALAGLSDADMIAQRLLRNQDDIGNAIKPYYGNAAGDKLTSLLRQHILIAADIVKAAKKSDSKSLTESQKKWHENATEIVVFLSGANPNWSKETLESMLFKHLDLTSAEVAARLRKDWGSDIKSFDEGEAHMLMLADALSDGIIKQFPKKFLH